MCSIVVAELRSKGIYDIDPDNGSLIPKYKEIKIIFISDPFSDALSKALVDDYNEESKP